MAFLIKPSIENLQLLCSLAGISSLQALTECNERNRLVPGSFNSCYFPVSFFGSRKISEITPKLIYEYKNRRRSEGASPCTINRELALMKHGFNMVLREWEWIRENPVIRVSVEKEPPSRDRWLTFEEEEALLAKSP